MCACTDCWKNICCWKNTLEGACFVRARRPLDEVPCMCLSLFRVCCGPSLGTCLSACMCLSPLCMCAAHTHHLCTSCCAGGVRLWRLQTATCWTSSRRWEPRACRARASCQTPTGAPCRVSLESRQLRPRDSTRCCAQLAGIAEHTTAGVSRVKPQRDRLAVCSGLDGVGLCWCSAYLVKGLDQQRTC